MSKDRAYFVNTREGFTSLWTPALEDGKMAILTRIYTVRESGEYYLQYYTDNYCAIELLAPEHRYTPIVHGEDQELIIRLERGENELRASVPLCDDGSIPTLHTRLIGEDGRIIRDDSYFEDRDYPVCHAPESVDIPDGYTPAVGRAIDAYGRFGFAKGDGVLDFSMPAFGIVSRPFICGVPKYKKHALWSFSLLPDGEHESGGAFLKTYKVPENERINVDWTHTTWRRELPCGKYISYDYSTVCSSLLIETNLDYISMTRMSAIGSPASATFSIEREGKAAFVTKTPDDGILYDRTRDGELKKNFVLLTRQGSFPEVPMLLTLPRSPKRITRDERGVRVEFDGEVGFALLTFLYGIELFDTEALTDEWYERAIEHALTVHSLSLMRPVTCEEYFKIADDKINIINKFTFRSFTDSLATPGLTASPLPPPVMLETLYGGAGKGDARAVTLGLPTKYGPLYAVLNSDVSEYSLPIPEYRDKFVFSGKCKEEFTKMLHSDFDEYISYHRDRGYIPNPGNYSFLFQYAYPYKLFPYLSPQDREKLETIMREGLDVIGNPDYAYIGPGGRRCLSWYERTEPFTGLSFLSTYLHATGISEYAHCDREIIEGSEGIFIEVDWGNAMSLYSTWLAALFTDSFDKLEESFPIIRRAFDFYLRGMDFACMAPGYAECGMTWNDGTNYGGYLGFINIADALGKREEFEIGLYAYSKLCCLRRGMFLSAQHYFHKYFGVEPWYIAKCFHEETDGEAAFISYPADIVSEGYRMESIYNLTTEGHYIEAFRMYAGFLPEELEKLLTAAERSAIGSITGEKIDTDTQYHSQKNGFLGEQETFSYLSLSTILERFTDEELEKMINDAAENQRISRGILGHYELSHRRVPKEWSRIMLLSHLYSQGQSALSAWRGLRIADATYPTVILTDVETHAWLEIYAEREPKATANGKKITFTRLRKNIYRADIKENCTLTFDI